MAAILLKLALSHYLKRRLQTRCSIKALIVCPSGDGMSLNSVQRTKKQPVKRWKL